MVIGMVFGLQGLSLIGQESPEATAVLILASSALCLYLGGSRADRAVTGVAVVGLLIGTFALLAALEVEGTGPGLIVLFIGVVLLGVGVWTARTTGPGPRAAFGSLTSPFGRPEPAAPPSQVPPPPPEEADR